MNFIGKGLSYLITDYFNGTLSINLVPIYSVIMILFFQNSDLPNAALL